MTTSSISSPTPAHAWRSPLLGELGALVLSAGRLEYFRRGRGPAIVFTHGWLSNANLWRNVVDRLADRYCCVTLDLPFGAHRVPLDPAADLSPEGCGRRHSQTMPTMNRQIQPEAQKISSADSR